MRRFSSYGPVQKDIDYYAPREELIERTYTQLVGEEPEYGGRMGLKEIALLVFVELSEEEAKQLEQEVQKNGINVIVLAVGIL